MSFPTDKDLSGRSENFFRIAQLARLANSKQETPLSMKTTDEDGGLMCGLMIVSFLSGMTQESIELAVKIGTILGNQDFRSSN
jgi:hypothetical protein